MTRGIRAGLAAGLAGLVTTMLAPLAAGQPPAVRAAAAPAVSVTTWALPSSEVGLASANQGPTYGQGGIVSWNGALWFAEQDAYKLGRMDLAGNISEFPIPASMGEAPYGPFMLSAARADELWLVQKGLPLESVVGVADPSGTVSLVKDMGYNGIDGIAADPTGGTWAIYGDGEGIGHLDSPTSEDYLEPLRYFQGKVAAAPDGSAWVADGYAVIKRVSPDGHIVNFPVPSSGGSRFSALTHSGGRIWYSKFSPGTMFTSAYGGAIGALTPQGQVTSYPMPVEDLVPVGLTPAADGGVWFVTGFGTGIGHLSATGQYRLASIPGGVEMESITVGPDGNIWFVDNDLNRIGTMTLADFDAATSATQPPPPPPPGTVDPAPGRVVKGRTPTVVKKRRAVVKIQCPTTATAGCSGTVKLSRVKGRKVLTKTATYAIEPGQRAKVRLRVTTRGVRLLPRRKRVKVVAALKADGGTSRTTLVLVRR